MYEERRVLSGGLGLVKTVVPARFVREGIEASAMAQRCFLMIWCYLPHDKVSSKIQLCLQRISS